MMSDTTNKTQPNSNSEITKDKYKNIKTQLYVTWFLLFIIVSIFIVWVIYFFSYNKTDNEGSIHLYSLNDYHGSVYQTDEESGLSELTYYLNELNRTNEENGDKSLFMLSGDNYSGTLESNYNEGELLSKAFNKMNVSYSAIGNHEFDYFNTNWNDELYKLEGVAGMQFLSANLVDKETQEILPFADPYAIEPITVDGVGTVNIGVLGLSTLETIKSGNPNVTLGLEVKDPAETAREYIPQMREEGADVVIALTHIPSVQEESSVIIGEEINDLASVEGIDAIFSAHSHEIVDGEINGVPIVQAGTKGSGLSEIKIDIEKDKNDISIKSIDGNVNMLYDEIANGEMSKTNAYVDTQVERYGAEIEELKNEELAYTDFDLIHERHGSNPKPTQLGALVSDLVIKSFVNEMNRNEALDEPIEALSDLKGKFSYESSLTIINDGGIRSSVDSGIVTYGDIYNVFPFGNTISVLEVTGEQVYELFEYGLSSGSSEEDINGNGIGPIQYDYGVKVTGDGSGYDLEAGLGEGDSVNKIEALSGTSRLINSDLDSVEEADYVEIERSEDETYLILTNSFIADGGDGFDAIIDDSNVIYSSSITTLDLMANELRYIIEANEGSLVSVPNYYENASSYQARYITE